MRIVGIEARASLYETAGTLAAYDFDGILLSVRALDDNATRIRTIAAMIKSAARKLNGNLPKPVRVAAQVKN